MDKQPQPDKISSFSDFARFLEYENTPDLMLFRGQGIDRPLLPKLARIEPDRELLAAEKEMMERFAEHSLPFLNRMPANDWEWLALAQHHGLPTRLLDWTSNPLIALWFAVAAPANASEHGVLWSFLPEEADYVKPSDNPYEGGRTKVFRPAHIAERIRMQAGYFTVHKLTSKKFVSFDRNSSYRRRLKKLIIPASSFANIRFTLDQYGINQAFVFPDLDGLCSHIQWLHTFLPDEAHLERMSRTKSWNLISTEQPRPLKTHQKQK